MKILLVHTYLYANGGDSIYTMRLGDLMQSQGHSVAYWGIKDPNNFQHEYSQFELDTIDYKREFHNFKFSNAIRVAFRAIYNKQARKLIGKVLDDFQPDVVHLQSIHYHITTSIIWEIKHRNIPIIWTQHNLALMCCSWMMNGLSICEKCKKRKFYFPLITRCKRNSIFPSIIGAIQLAFDQVSGVYNKIDQYIAISNFYAQKMNEFGFDKNNIEVVNNFFEPKSIEEIKDVLEKSSYIIFFGRLSKEKGLYTLLSAMKKLPVDLRLIIAGDGPLRNKLECLSEGMDNVCFVGSKSWQELSTLIMGAEFSIIPSIWYENFPNTIMESYACECPVIGSRIGGIPEMIREGETGLLFTAGDSSDLAEKIMHLHTNIESRKAMGIQARKVLAGNYSVEKHYHALIGIYKRISTNG